MSSVNKLRLLYFLAIALCVWFFQAIYGIVLQSKENIDILALVLDDKFLESSKTLIIFALLLLILRQILVAEQDWQANTVAALKEELEKFREYIENTIQVGDISILVDKNDWISRRDELIGDILDGRLVSDDTTIRATSSFHPIENMGNNYFEQLARVALNDQNGIKYHLLIQSEPDEKLVEEMCQRINSFNMVSGDQGWHFGTQFQARKYPFKSNIDVLIYGEYLFINIKVGEGENPPRKYIMIKNKEIASIFVQWFECLYRGNSVVRFEHDDIKGFGYLYDDYMS